MSTMFVTCAACGGLSPAAGAACVHCDGALRERRFARVARGLGRAVLGGGALVMLMACYGMVRPTHGPGAACDDFDRDTVCAPRDCDDGRADVFPGAADPDLDRVDQNCDGVDGVRDPATIATDPPAAPPPSEPVAPTAPPPSGPVAPTPPP